MPKLKYSSRTKKNTINVYAKNMRFMSDNISLKKLLSNLSSSLNENQWLKVSKEKYKPMNYVKENENKNKNAYEYGFKPNGSFYSKGGWLFHESTCCKLDDEIILVEIDYSRIYRITGKEPYTSPIKDKVYKKNIKTFMDKYGKLFGKDKCSGDNEPSLCNYSNNEVQCKNNGKPYCYWESNKCNTNTKLLKQINSKCKKLTKKAICMKKDNHCFWEEQFKIFNWGPLYNEYDGFAIYPYPEMELLKKYKKDAFAFYMYDVESLILWNHKPVIKHYNLGTIAEIIKDLKINSTEDYETIIESFIPKLIDKIKNINGN